VREQAAEVRIAGRIGGPDDERPDIHRFEVDSDNELQAGLFGGVMSPHDARERGPVGDRERLVAERRRTDDELVGVGGTPQEREVARAVQFGIPRCVIGHVTTFSCPSRS